MTNVNNTLTSQLFDNYRQRKGVRPMNNNGMQVSDMNRKLTDYEKRVVDFAKAYHSGKKLTSEQLRTKAEIDHNNLVSETLKQIADVQARFGC